MTKEELLKKQTFIDLFSIPSEIERVEKEIELSEIAKSLQCQKEFKELLKAWKKEFSNNMLFDNEIILKDIPLKGLTCDTFICNKKGIFKKGEVICYHPLIPIEIYTNKKTGNEKVKLAFYKRRKWNDCIVDKDVISSATRIVKLSKKGIEITSENARGIINYLNEVINKNIDIIPTGESISTLGWDDIEFAPYNNASILDGTDDFKQVFESIKEKGSYEEWYKVVKELRKNNIVKIAMATTFASPLLEKMDIMPYIVNIWSSASGTGKTVACMVAISCWGDPSNQGLQFSSDSTTNYYIKVASFLKNITMFCDEFQKVKYSDSLDELVMILANGREKGRLTKERETEETGYWNNNFLFTNNDKLSKENFGEQVFNRIIDIECNEKIISNGNKIVGVIKKNYGFAGKKYIEYISKIGFKSINERVRNYTIEICEKYSATEKQATCIATLLVANELSQECLFPNEDKLTIEDLKDSINDREEILTWKKAYNYIINHFVANDNKFDNSFTECWGRRTDYYYMVNKGILVRELQKGGFEFDSIKKDWDKNEILERNSQGRYATYTKIGNYPKAYYVQINKKEL